MKLLGERGQSVRECISCEATVKRVLGEQGEEESSDSAGDRDADAG